MRVIQRHGLVSHHERKPFSARQKFSPTLRASLLEDVRLFFLWTLQKFVDGL